MRKQRWRYYCLLLFLLSVLPRTAWMYLLNDDMNSWCPYDLPWSFHMTDVTLPEDNRPLQGAERTYFPCVCHANKISAIPIEWGLPLAIRQQMEICKFPCVVWLLWILLSVKHSWSMFYDMVSTVLLSIEDLRFMTICVFLQKIKTKRFHFLSTSFLYANAVYTQQSK